MLFDLRRQPDELLTSQDVDEVGRRHTRPSEIAPGIRQRAGGLLRKLFMEIGQEGVWRTRLCFLNAPTGKSRRFQVMIVDAPAAIAAAAT